MGFNQPIRTGLRSLFTAAKAVIAPMPEAELPLIRHPEMEGNGDLEFWGDLKYLFELQREILSELKDGAYLWEMPLPVEGIKFWQEFNHWPDDIAATQLACWKYGPERAA